MLSFENQLESIENWRWVSVLQQKKKTIYMDGFYFLVAFQFWIGFIYEIIKKIKEYINITI